MQLHTQRSKTIVQCVMIAVLVSITHAQQQQHDYCDVLAKSLLFYEAQRSGRLPPSNRVTWRGNSALNDCTDTGCTRDSNGDGNLAGGYYDAGDGVKFAYPLAYTLTTLSWAFLEGSDAIQACGQTNNYRDAIRWGMDWMIKAHPSPSVFWAQVGNGGIDHSFWGPPETMTMSRPSFKIDQNNPGTDMAMSASASFASAYLVFKSVDAKYAETLITHARQLWTFGNTYRGLYSDSIPDASIYYKSYGFYDDLVWGTAWMARATGEASYMNSAKDDYDNYGIQYMAMGQSFDWDQKAPGVMVLMAKITGETKYTQQANKWLSSWTKGNGMIYTPAGLAWLRQWGPLRYTGGASFVASLIGSPSWTKSQIDYMLGSNPSKFSYVCGYGTAYPKNPHHRAAHGSSTNDINSPSNNKYVLTGALVGGPGSDDDYFDSRSDYIKNEVALDYNAGFTAAVVIMAKTYGSGSSSPSSSPTPTPTSKPTPTPPVTTAPTPAPTKKPAVGATNAPTSPSPSPSPSSSPNTKPLKVIPHNGGSAWWVAVDISDSTKDISKVEIRDNAAVQTWASMTKQTWGYWTYQPNGQPVSSPFFIRVTSSVGSSVTVLVLDFSSGSYNSGVNF
eukprot:TRINITY_DN2812_c0_g1_i1.p1 TRINITY_DN2812_c0_g1~~TRINITY_DN2812_c0_g1_i1.p1  ORF type:complete len:616 (+),score=213.81 TRINITY_DN2812_c0_g1_i1:83-1930(+)